MSELITKKSAMHVLEQCRFWNDGERKYAFSLMEQVEGVEPDVPDINVGDINKFIDGLEEIFADLRERHVDDSVCGLCEYDGAYIGQSGEWCNECPGFEKDDCFKLSGKVRKDWTDEIIKALPSAEPEIKPISYMNCANAMLKMWIDNVLTDGEYNKIMDKLNAKHKGEQDE